MKNVPFIFKTCCFLFVFIAFWQVCLTARQTTEPVHVKVAVSPDFSPLYLKDNTSSACVGYYADLFDKLGDFVGVDFELVSYLDRAEGIEDLNAGLVDACSYTVCSMQPGNATFASIPFYFYFLFGDYNPDKLILFPGTKVGVMEGVDVEGILKERFEGVNAVFFSCPSKAVAALDSGLVDGLVISPFLCGRYLDLKKKFIRSRYPVFTGRIVFKYSANLERLVPGFAQRLSEFLKTDILKQLNECWFKDSYNDVVSENGSAWSGMGKWIWMFCFVCLGLFSIFRYCGQGFFIAQHGAARQELEQMRTFVDLASIMIVALDVNGNVAFINQAGCSTIGFEKEYIEGKNWLETFVYPTHRKAAEKIFDRLKQQSISGGRKYRGYLLNSTGSKRLISYISTPLFDAEGNYAGMFCSGEDITDTVNAQQEAIKQQEHLMQAGKMVSLGVLSSGIAHEINNPNNFIMLNAPVILDIWKSAVLILDEYYEDNGEFLLGGLPYSMARQKVTTLCSGILDGSRRIQRIVNDLKDFARKDTVGYDDAVDINEVLKSSITLTFSMIKKSTVNFDVSYGEMLPYVKGNFQKLEQVVINLIQNACHALEDKSQGIFIKTFAREGNVIIRVKDEGKGIPKKLIKQIGEPFFTTRRSSGGTGLGLSISMNIVKKLSGRITFDSILGKGTQVTIILPAIKK